MGIIILGIFINLFGCASAGLHMFVLFENSFVEKKIIYVSLVDILNIDYEICSHNLIAACVFLTFLSFSFSFFF